MSTVNSVGISPSQLSSALAAINGGVEPNASHDNLSLSQLQRTLRQQLDQVFKQGASLDDTGNSLAEKVSATLQQYGVSEDQRNQVVDGLSQIFSQAGSRAEARQNAQQYLDNFVQSLSSSPSTGQLSSVASPFAGQNFDASA
jgi:hypothetical protein